MSSFRSLLFAVPAAASLLALAPDAAACGACIHGENENTQVVGHRMIFSVSPTETTLWDQIAYSGDPSSFAWVLPIKGVVQVGLSSDALFETLNGLTAVTVVPPPLPCPPPPPCFGGVDNGFGGASGGGADAGGVDVLAQAVVGPYETVQLSASDPAALANWLSSHGYVLPADFAPVVSAYIAEGFGFLAMKLVPGKGITSMKPVRVTSPGAGATLPLRMVAGGTGVTTPITLWILGQGRYEPQNFPTFTVDPQKLVWDFSTSSSNYKALRQQGYDASQGRGWLIETSGATSPYSISGPLDSAVTYDPTHSGYGDEQGVGAAAELAADLAKLDGNIPAGSLWLTRVRAELPRAALATDLTLGAAAQQESVSGVLQATKGINAPPCPTYPPCDNTGGSGGTGGAGGAAGGSGGTVTGTVRDGTGGGCAVGGSSETTALGVLALAGLLAARRRRR